MCKFKTRLNLQRLLFNAGIGGVLLLLTFPFVQPWHSTPIPSFQSEWLAILFGMLALLPLLPERNWPFPGSAMLALGLAAVVLIQVLLQLSPVPSLLIVYLGFLLWAAGLACLGRYLVSQMGLENAVRYFAFAIMGGAFFAAISSLLQPWLLPVGWLGLSPAQGGPLAQANHFANYLWLGLGSAMYLRAVRVIPGLCFWPLVCVLVATAAFTGQRSPILYATIFAVIAEWSYRSRKNSSMRLPAVGVAVIFFCLQPLLSVVPPWWKTADKAVPLLRAASELGQPSYRVMQMRPAYEAIVQRPLQGAGIGSYPSLSLKYADLIAPESNLGPTEHAHNLFVHVAAEMGVPVALAVFFASLVWIRRLLSRDEQNEVTWAMMMFSVIGLHSLLEYPLWYGYFLGPLALILGMFGGSKVVSMGWRLRTCFLAALLFGGIGLAECKRDYRYLELAYLISSKSDALPVIISHLSKIPSSSPLFPWVNATACVNLDPLTVDPQDGMEVCTKGMAFAPTLESGVNAVILYWRAGENGRAEHLLRQIRLASHYKSNDLQQQIKLMIEREPRLSWMTTV